MFLIRVACLAVGAIGAVTVVLAMRSRNVDPEPEQVPVASGSSTEHQRSLRPRMPFDTSGFRFTMPPDGWNPASLTDIRQSWVDHTEKLLRDFEEGLSTTTGDLMSQIDARFEMTQLMMNQGRPAEAHEVLQSIRDLLEEEDGELKQNFLASVIYFQGVAALRRGEDENCIMCRGESSCILPISDAAVHQNASGSRQAIVHFTEYLEEFPDDLEVKWLLNLAHMTLGEYPDGVDSRYRLSLDPYLNSEFDIGRFRDVGHIVGCNRFNQAGGAIMDDFNNDGLLDLVATSFDVNQEIAVYENNGQGRFEEIGEEAGVMDQLGGLNCVQADYNNDGLVDIFVVRGAWLNFPIRPSLLRNDGDFHFTDVTAEAGVDQPINSNAAQWADYDNDGWLDLFVCCESQDHRLYHNQRDGTFEERAALAGLLGDGQSLGKGCTWVDIDNDDDQDLYISYFNGIGHLYENNGNGTFANANRRLEGGGTEFGFSCWSWDFNNDGWLDIFATCYERSLTDVVRGLMGQPHEMPSNKLFLNLEGNGFRDVAAETGLDLVFATMGSNFGDYDNDGYLDFYLGTGDPDLGTLVPNRMFRNVGGERFAEITTSAGVGHLQKGHGIACGDWDRDGDVDIFSQLGGVLNGDRFHNVLFQNPGHGRSSVTLQLTGVESNRSAIGARIMLVTSGAEPQTIHRHVSSGSSFGANPLEQTIGLGDATGIDRIEVHWPTSGETQVFHDVPADKILRISEFSDEIEVIDLTPIPLPEETPAMSAPAAAGASSDPRVR